MKPLIQYFVLNLKKENIFVIFITFLFLNHFGHKHMKLSAFFTRRVFQIFVTISVTSFVVHFYFNVQKLRVRVVVDYVAFGFVGEKNAFFTSSYFCEIITFFFLKCRILFLKKCWRKLFPLIGCNKLVLYNCF